MTPSPLDSGSLVLDGRFSVLRHIGGGGMGDVYLAEQVSLGRRVAVKVLRQDLSVQPGMSERFRREARLLSSVDHPAVVRVIDFGESHHHSCLVMELAEGRTLHSVLSEEGPLPPARALPLLAQLCEGLEAIHERGIVHRDLKPENVVLCAGPRGGEQARLLDFGIARLAEAEGPDNNLSQVGTVVGTPEYLSPEQALGHRVDFKSDLYSFGVLAYRMLAGRLPFPGPSPRQFLAQHVGSRPTPLEEVVPELGPQALYAVVMQCLAKEPSRRPTSALALANVFLALAEGRAPELGRTLTPSSGLRLTRPAQAGRQSATVPLEREAPPAVREELPPDALAGDPPYLLWVELAPPPPTEPKDAVHRARAEFERFFLPLARAQGGRLLLRRDDGSLLLFDRPREALDCARALQDRLHRHNRSSPPERHLRARMVAHPRSSSRRKTEVTGPPLLEVAQATPYGEVVLTESFLHALGKKAPPWEPLAAPALPGLCRLVGSREGFPYGGMDLAPKERRWGFPLAVSVVAGLLAMAGFTLAFLYVQS